MHAGRCHRLHPTVRALPPPSFRCLVVYRAPLLLDPAAITCCLLPAAVCPAEYQQEIIGKNRLGIRLLAALVAGRPLQPMLAKESLLVVINLCTNGEMWRHQIPLACGTNMMVLVLGTGHCQMIYTAWWWRNFLCHCCWN